MNEPLRCAACGRTLPPHEERWVNDDGEPLCADIEACDQRILKDHPETS